MPRLTRYLFLLSYCLAFGLVAHAQGSAPGVGDLYITEFMADPNPVVGLPEAEYVELYNAGSTAISLADVWIGSGGTPVALSGGMEPAAYVVVTRPRFAEAFQALGVVVIPANLPGLTNGGDNITLLRGADTIFALDYSGAWYDDPDRDGGGYSLEYTGSDGADAGCSGLWRASQATDGGTPGKANSVLGSPTDTSAPVITGTEVGADAITVSFNEPISGATPDFLLLSGETEIGVAGTQIFEGGATFRLDILDTIEQGRQYRLIVPGVRDCVGNAAEEQSLALGIPEAPGPGDVVINELLFNPVTDASDYLELYNCSDKILQISGWKLTNAASTSTGSAREITAARLLFPGEFLTLTDDPVDLVARFSNVDQGGLVGQTLPSLPNDGGNITISAAGVMLDSFDYSEDLHSELLNDPDGVSLERLRYKVATNDPANWFTASSSEGYGTPTRANSQARMVEASPPQGNFALVNTTFSPDGDGYEDVLEITYRDVPVGSLARVQIFDAQGRPVRTLRDAELLGTAGTFRWDGADGDGRRARVGVHVLVIEISNPSGPVVVEKLVAVLAGGR